MFFLDTESLEFHSYGVSGMVLVYSFNLVIMSSPGELFICQIISIFELHWLRSAGTSHDERRNKVESNVTAMNTRLRTMFIAMR